MKISREYKIGAFVVCVLALSFFIINWLRGADIFARETTLKASFDDVETLVVSDPLYIKGYKAGRVDRIVYNPSTDKFDVTCSVKGQFRIPTDSKLTIYSVDIMGGKGVKVDLGSSSSLVEKSATLEGTSEPDMIGTVTESLGPLLARMSSALDSLTVTVSSVNSLLSDDNRASISRSLAHLDRSMTNLTRISSVVSDNTGEIDSIVKNLSSLSTQLSTVASSAKGAIDDFSSLENSVKSDLVSVIRNLDAISGKIADPDGSAARLLDGQGFFNNIEALVSDLDKLIENITENPKKYLKIKVF